MEQGADCTAGAPPGGRWFDPSVSPSATPSANAAALARWRRIMRLVLIWSIPGILTATHAYVMFGAEGKPLSFADALRWQLPNWYYWVPATPLILWLGRKFPFERGRLRRSIPVHIGAWIALTIPHAVVMLASARYLANRPWYSEGSFFDRLQVLTPWILNHDLLIFGAVAASGFALEFRRRFREKELFTARLEARLAQAELSTLRAQLQPHFLFNTLNAISTLIRAGHNDRAQKTLTTLSRLLRYTLDSMGRATIPLHEEMDFARDYLGIQETRLGDRLRVRFEVDPAVAGAGIPALILQPLVENAVVHGIAPLEEGGEVVVRASAVGGQLRMQVMDDGVGVTPRTVTDSGSEVGDEDGHGLSIVRGRLAHVYGQAHRFTIERGDKGGTMITIELPMREVDDETE